MCERTVADEGGGSHGVQVRGEDWRNVMGGGGGLEKCNLQKHKIAFPVRLKGCNHKHTKKGALFFNQSETRAVHGARRGGLQLRFRETKCNDTPSVTRFSR